MNRLAITTGPLGLILLGAALVGCDDGPTAVDAGTELELTVHGLRPLNPATEGRYELWAINSGGAATSAGRFDVGTGSETRVSFTLPIGDASTLRVTVEPPGDTDEEPSEQVLLAGALRGGAANLTILGAVTDGRPLERDPGHHSLFTTSNNVAEGYPSMENAGLWLFSISSTVNKHQSREVKLTPLRRSWFYEGWIVRHLGRSDEVWIPYGKFRPDQLGLLTSRDNTGSGFFSGDADYVNGGVEDAPGDEWTTTRVAAQLGLEVPGDLSLPLALDSVDAVTGVAEWYHVITIEPGFDEFEPPLTDQPFLLRPYRNPVGAGPPGDPREILYQDNDPSGEVRPVS